MVFDPVRQRAERLGVCAPAESSRRVVTSKYTAAQRETLHNSGEYTCEGARRLRFPRFPRVCARVGDLLAAEKVFVFFLTLGVLKIKKKTIDRQSLKEKPYLFPHNIQQQPKMSPPDFFFFFSSGLPERN